MEIKLHGQQNYIFQLISQIKYYFNVILT